MSAFAGEHNPEVLIIGHGTPQTLTHSSRLALLRILQGDGRSWPLFCWSLGIRSRAQWIRQNEHQLDCPRRRDASHSFRKSRYTPNSFSTSCQFLLFKPVSADCSGRDTNRVMTCVTLLSVGTVQPVKTVTVHTVSCSPRAHVTRFDTAVLDSKTTASRVPGAVLSAQRESLITMINVPWI